ncbi:MAG: hypothetical protein LBH29_07150 [Elusimicrobiota bacterium]|jgi:AcrR family transcriptional regulator|nr:hypothetical protein [Elusimicrobiota bacterium]
MGRIPQHLDEKLIECGKAVLLKHGIRAINIRSICAETKINLGMFVYYFKSRSNFIKTILESFIKDMEVAILNESKDITDPLQKLKCVMTVSLKIGRQNHATFEKIVEDIDSSSEEMLRSLHQSIQSKYKGFWHNLIEDCKAQNYIDQNLETEKITSVFVGGLLFYAKSLESLSLSDEQYEQKVNEMMDFLLEKIAPPPTAIKNFGEAVLNS